MSPAAVQALHVNALSQPNSPPVCPKPPAAPPSLQADPRMRPECPGDHLLLAGRGLLWEDAPKSAKRSADTREWLSSSIRVGSYEKARLHTYLKKSRSKRVC
uniref:Uncharacterized protein n=1 Tax=Dunaliella tertiolecta TaxID=3047 RepID=A0A7S3R6D8_DUNTE|eukprot:1149914-Pelagomonas_calceolata.AAC.4